MPAVAAGGPVGQASVRQRVAAMAAALPHLARLAEVAGHDAEGSLGGCDTRAEFEFTSTWSSTGSRPGAPADRPDPSGQVPPVPGRPVRPVCDAPPMHPTLTLAGERTVPGIPAENYWFPGG